MTSRLLAKTQQGLGDALGRRIVGRHSHVDLLNTNTLRQKVRNVEFPLRPDASNAEKAWTKHQREVTENILNRDPRKFLSWPDIKHTMFVGQERWVRIELDYLRSRSDWENRWKPALKESSVGRPSRFIYYPFSSANLIHHAYQIAKFEELAGRQISSYSQIFEFGGGYGSMCRVAWNLGFRGTYIILDQEPFSSLQSYYLTSIGLPIDSRVGLEVIEPAIFCTSSFEEANHAFQKGTDIEGSLYIATWSLSETPQNIRDLNMNFVTQSGSKLINFQDAFHGIDNLAFFENFLNNRTETNWKLWKIDHIPGNHGLVGIPHLSGL